MTYTADDVNYYNYIGDVKKLRIALNYNNNSKNWIKNNEGWNALHFASVNGNTECVKVLIDTGIDFNIKELIYGHTALHLCTI